MFTVLHLPRVPQVRWLPALILALVLLLAPVVAGLSPAASSSVSTHAAPLIAGGPLVNCSGALAPC